MLDLGHLLRRRFVGTRGLGIHTINPRRPLKCNHYGPLQCVSFPSISPGLHAQLLPFFEALPSPYSQYERHVVEAQSAVASHFPSIVISAIRTFTLNPYAPGALLLSGLPLDPFLPPTPRDGWRSEDKTTFISEGCLTGIARLIGEPFGYKSEKDGEIIHNICPVQNHERKQSNESSREALELHVENASFDFPPDYLALCCLRQDHDKKAMTTFVDLRYVLAKMSPEDVEILRKPYFIVPTPESHHAAMGGEIWSRARPVFETFENPNLFCHFPGMKALNLQAQKALDSFENIIRQPGILFSVKLKPGNVLLLNNRKVAHGRTCFEPRYDGTDRWLQRIYIRALQ
ncbi:mitochondrial protein [Apiospora marii]|uniref:Mitochondrial protein n=1 Tax=Apiospora marii TaxID=335849 RepID=A0ABR1R3I3_9PEZI